MKFQFKRIPIITFLLLLLVVGHIFMKNVAYSDELDDLNKQIADLQSALTSSQNATKPLESQLTGLKKQLDNIDFQVKIIENDIAKKRADIDKSYANLSDNQKLFNTTVRSSYINNYGFTPLLILASFTTK